MMLDINILSRIEQTLISTRNGGRLCYVDPSTIAWFPHYHGSIGLFRNGAWRLVTPTTTSGAIYFDIGVDTDINNAPLIENKNYDIFATDSGDDNFMLEMQPWASNTGRGYSLADQDGIVVHSVEQNGKKRRYLGIIRTISNSGAKFADSETQRFICNLNNRIPRIVKTYNSSSSNWTSSTSGAWMEYGGSSPVRGEFLYLWPSELLFGGDQPPYCGENNSAMDAYLTVGLNSSTTISIGLYSRWLRNDASPFLSYPAAFMGYPRLGYNYITQLISSYQARNMNTYGGDRSGAFLCLYI